MRELDHIHLIKAISAYEKGTERYFVFPWPLKAIYVSSGAVTPTSRINK